MFTVNIYFKHISISNSSNQSIFCDYTFICERKLSWPPPSCVADGLLTYDPPPPDTHRACKEASNRWTIDPKPGVWWGRVWVSSLTPALRWNRPTELTLNWEQTRSRRQIIRSVLCWSVRTLLNQSFGVWSLVNITGNGHFSDYNHNVQWAWSMMQHTRQDAVEDANMLIILWSRWMSQSYSLYSCPSFNVLVTFNIANFNSI